MLKRMWKLNLNCKNNEKDCEYWEKKTRTKRYKVIVGMMENLKWYDWYIRKSDRKNNTILFLKIAVGKFGLT